MFNFNFNLKVKVKSTFLSCLNSYIPIEFDSKGLDETDKGVWQFKISQTSERLMHDYPHFHMHISCRKTN